MNDILTLVTDEINNWEKKYVTSKQNNTLITAFYNSLTKEEISYFKNFFLENAKALSTFPFKESIILLAKKVDNLFNSNNSKSIINDLIYEEMWEIIKRITNFSYTKIDSICNDMDTFEISTKKILDEYFRQEF